MAVWHRFEAPSQAIANTAGLIAGNPILHCQTMNNPEKPRLPLPPFDYESAIQKVRITDEIEGITSDAKANAAYSITRQVLTVI